MSPRPAALSLAGTAPAQDQQTQDQDPADNTALARELSNPTAALMGLGSSIDFTSFAGDLDGADRSAVSYLFQPGLPFPQANGYNLLFRPAIPIQFNQPVFDANTQAFGSEASFGNIGFDLAYGTTFPDSGFLYFVGMVGSVPSASSEELRGQWAFGPEVAIGVAKPWGVVGMLLTQSWDAEGGDESTNTTGGQYFYAFALPNAWQIAAGPSWSYNHVTDQLTFPVATGLSKTTRIGTMPLKLSAQAWYYVAKPDAFGPEWQLRFSVTPVIPIPW